MSHFYVSYERWTRDEYDEAEDNTMLLGIVVKTASLREAIEIGLELRDISEAGVCEPDNYEYARRITFHEWNESARETTGIIETRTLHIPIDVTEASRVRIIRLFIRDPYHREACKYAKNQIDEYRRGQQFINRNRRALIQAQLDAQQLIEDIKQRPDGEEILREAEKQARKLTTRNGKT